MFIKQKPGRHSCIEAVRGFQKERAGEFGKSSGESSSPGSTSESVAGTYGRLLAAAGGPPGGVPAALPPLLHAAWLNWHERAWGDGRVRAGRKAPCIYIPPGCLPPPEWALCSFLERAFVGSDPRGSKS